MGRPSVSNVVIGPTGNPLTVVFEILSKRFEVESKFAVPLSAEAYRFSTS